MIHPLSELAEKLEQNRPALVLTGAGISTRSGIPAYRNPAGDWIHPRPVLAAQFKGSDSTRRRYWRRSMNGWPSFNKARPNAAHKALVQLQRGGLVANVVTQNVDGLHQLAGTTDTIELHGALRNIICLQCGERSHRSDMQTELLQLNPDFVNEDFTLGADGDATPTNTALKDSDFVYPECRVCNGILKPDVVFFGENVPALTAQAGREALHRAGCLLCIGTSLTVLSGFRYCREAKSQTKPVYLINQGNTRADEIVTLKIDSDCTDALTTLTSYLCN
jgi:NAD-dependent SIR2 family protein deacetylase